MKRTTTLVLLAVVFAATVLGLLFANPVQAQTVCTYTEQNGAVKNCIGVQVTNGATPQNTTQVVGASIATNQVAIGTTSTLLVAARATRQTLQIAVTTAVACAFGPVGVTLVNGFPTQPVAGASFSLTTAGAVYGVCGTAATPVAFIETYP